jgi:hypothetical protein
MLGIRYPLSLQPSMYLLISRAMIIVQPRMALIGDLNALEVA